VSSPQVLYRLSSNSMSAEIVNQEAEILQVMDKAFAVAPPHLQYLKQQSMANLYQYLTFRVLEGPLSRPKAIAAARCWLKAVIADISLLFRQSKLMLVVSVKILLGLLLPASLARNLLAKVKTAVRR